MLQKGGHVISFTKELEKSAAIADDKDMREEVQELYCLFKRTKIT